MFYIYYLLSIISNQCIIWCIKNEKKMPWSVSSPFFGTSDHE